MCACRPNAWLAAGVPHIRRELEMPAAALHHAGVHARQLELLEAALREVSIGGDCQRAWQA
jgi:hypothetical protein